MDDSSNAIREHQSNKRRSKIAAAQAEVDALNSEKKE